MMTCGLKRSVLLLLCVASALLSGCVSRGKYDDLQGQYTTLHGQYTTLQRQYGDLQGQYKQLQQSSAAKCRSTCRREAGSGRREDADWPVPGGHQVHPQQRLAVPAGLLGDRPAGEGSDRQAGPEIGAVSAEQARGERLYRQRPHRSSAEAEGRHLERGAVAKACRSSDA